MALYFILAVPLLAAIWLFLVFPRVSKHTEFEPFEKKLIAHRGLFGGAIPENSVEAFERACEAGYGIELDVQLTSDGVPVVFHDETLSRMCSDPRKVSSVSFSELSLLRLKGTDERIPSFSDALSAVGGRAPLIIEIKPYGERRELCRKVSEELAKYNGVFCMESFDPLVLRYFKKNLPSVIRGQLTQDYFRSGGGLSFAGKTVMTCLFANFLGRPDFIAYNRAHRMRSTLRTLKRCGAVKIVAWTVRSREELASSSEYDAVIFDSFTPEAAPEKKQEGTL
ncbi:MAG: glycerophosphodiester phosphodiesterase [Clostridia bacterium]|nr:glycerophosphodiester phosphodiesterase [Clostridia bacterium]